MRLPEPRLTGKHRRDALEFVFALVSIITSLGLTQIIGGVVAIIRHKDRAGFSFTHALWVWIAFAVVIGNWGVLWSARLQPEWPAFRVVGWLVSTSSLYAFCVFVLPEVGAPRPLNLKEFHEWEGPRYILAHNIFVVAAIVLLVTVIGITSSQLFNLVSALLALAFGIAALLTRTSARSKRYRDMQTFRLLYFRESLLENAKEVRARDLLEAVEKAAGQPPDGSKHRRVGIIGASRRK